MPASLPDHLHRYRAAVDDFDAFAESLRAPLPQTLATNTARLTPQRLQEVLDAEFTLTPVSWRPGAFRLHPEDRPGRHFSFTSGLYSIQEEASLLPVAMLDARPGHRVLDLCAAPGNKTAQLALALENRGTVIANDLKTGRLTALHDLCRRLGLLNVSTTGHDGSVYPISDAQFDRILVDAPCTAEGKARRGYMRDSPRNFRLWVSGQQRALLRRAVELLRPGGRLVYSTCTFAPEENEAVVSDILEWAAGRVRTIAPATELPGAVPGLCSFEDQSFHPELRHARRLWPHLTNTGGFFAVVLERVGTDAASAVQPELLELPPAGAVSGIHDQIARFDIPDSDVEHLYLFEDDRNLRAVSADHARPAGVSYENTGLDVARKRARATKLSTPGAMALGQHAHANVLDLDAETFRQWRRRIDLPLSAAAVGACTRGAVLIRHQGLVHGTGFLRRDETGAGTLESQFPKAWMLGPTS